MALFGLVAADEHAVGAVGDDVALARVGAADGVAAGIICVDASTFVRSEFARRDAVGADANVVALNDVADGVRAKQINGIAGPGGRLAAEDDVACRCDCAADEVALAFRERDAESHVRVRDVPEAVQVENVSLDRVVV